LFTGTVSPPDLWQTQWDKIFTNDYVGGGFVTLNGREKYLEPDWSNLGGENQPGQLFELTRRNCVAGLWTVDNVNNSDPDFFTVHQVRGVITDDDVPSISMPSVLVPRPYVTGKKPTLIEIVSVDFFNAHDVTTNSAVDMYLSTRPLPNDDFSNHSTNPSVVASMRANSHEDTSGAITRVWPKTVHI